jgi:hypothetical protein
MEFARFGMLKAINRHKPRQLTPFIIGESASSSGTNEEVSAVAMMG